jgi:hypothetical protein
MIIDETTDAFWILYLVNVLQPVSGEDVEERSRALLERMNRKVSRVSVPGTLSSLETADMIIRRQDGRYAVTLLGLQGLSRFHFGFSRDKNRMFVLKDKLRK